MGQILGGILPVLLFSWFWEWALWKRTEDDPLAGKLKSVGSGWLTASLLGTFAFGPMSFILYGISAVIISGFAYWRGMQARQRLAEEDISRTFE